MSRKKRDETRREAHIERRRESIKETPKRKQKKVSSNAQRTPVTPSPVPSTRISHAAPTHNDAYSEKNSKIISELNTLSSRSRNLPQSVNQLDKNINEISTRIQNVRKNGYHSQANLDDKSRDLENNWNNISQNVESISLEKSNLLMQNASALEANIKRAGSLNELIQFESQLSHLNQEIFSAENMLRGQLDNYQSKYQTIDNDLRVVEETVSNLVNTSIGWKNNESPILAVKIHDLTNDQKGVLTLSNLRILFEEIKEEVIKRNLFFATEKKTIREVIIDQPIGSIDEIEKGRVGLFKGAGLYIKFKPQTGLDEIKIDTSGNEDDQIIHFYNYIISGEAEKELDPIKETLENITPVACPTCSAPYREEILKGQTSVKCIYCGSVIKI